MLLRVLGPAPGVCLALGPVFPEVAHRGPSLIRSLPFCPLCAAHVCMCACLLVCVYEEKGGGEDRRRRGQKEERTEWDEDERTWGSASNSFTRVWSGGSTLRYLFFGALQGRLGKGGEILH